MMKEVIRDDVRLWVFLKASAAVRLIASVPPRWAELLDIKRLGKVDLRVGKRGLSSITPASKCLKVGSYLRIVSTQPGRASMSSQSGPSNCL